MKLPREVAVTVKVRLTEVCWVLSQGRKKMMFHFMSSLTAKPKGRVPVLCPHGPNKCAKWPREGWLSSLMFRRE
jgi:hypothetical protein